MVASIRDRMVTYVHNLQDEICRSLEVVDGVGMFHEDHWERPGGGGGRSRAIANGSVFEKGGVNVSVVHGDLPASLASRRGIEGGLFFATGISLVLHPHSPHVPTVHANFRYFEGPQGAAWFGGGADLTPYVPNEADAVHFHSTLKQAADPFGAERYPHYKAWCDDYFTLRHRGERRGVGGIFYDDLGGDEADLEEHFAFQCAIGDAFLSAYLPIVQRRRDTPFTERQKKFQCLRRGRYVEFNLVYDRGTLFGLETRGRTESILMSLPPVVHFDYNAEMERDDDERTLTAWLRTPREWAK